LKDLLKNVIFIVLCNLRAWAKLTKKSFVRKENLERLGLWVKGGASTYNHQMDAFGHLLQYMIKNNIQKQELLEKGWSK